MHGDTIFTRKSKFYTGYDLNGLIDPSGAQLQAMATAGVIPAQITSTLDLGGFVMAAGNILTGMIPVPMDLDPNYPIGFSVWWSGDWTSGTGTASWILLQGAVSKYGAISVPATALDTVIALANQYSAAGGGAGAADALFQVTDRGIRNSVGLTRQQVVEGALLTLSLEMDAVGGTMASINFLFLEMDYVPRMTQGSPALIDAPLIADMDRS